MYKIFSLLIITLLTVSAHSAALAKSAPKISSEIIEQLTRSGMNVTESELLTTKDPQIVKLLAMTQSNYGQKREAIETYNRLIDIIVSGNSDERNYYFTTGVLNAILAFNALQDARGLADFYLKWYSDSRLSDDEKIFIHTNAGTIISSMDGGSEYQSIFTDDIQAADQDIYERSYLNEQKAWSLMIKNHDIRESQSIIGETIELLKNTPDVYNLYVRFNILCELLFFYDEDFESAKKQNDICLELISKIDNYESYKEYYSLLCRRGIYSHSVKDYKTAAHLLLKVIDLEKTATNSLQNDENRKYTGFYTHLVNCNHTAAGNQLLESLIRQNMCNKAAEIVTSNYELDKDLLLFTLSNLTRNNPNRDENIRVMRNRLASVAVHCEADSMTGKLFDYMLLSKQAYLSAEKLLTRLIMNSGDDRLIDKFNQLTDIRDQIRVKLLSGESVTDLKEIEKSLESQISYDVCPYGDYIAPLKLSWKDIRKALTDKDIAIEFVSYQDLVSQKEMIVAILLRKDWKSPRLIQLIDSEEIPKDPYNDTEFARKFWSPVIKLAGDVENIYFAPAGQLHNIGIESMRFPGSDIHITDKYNMFRLSSTRELTKRGERAVNIEETILFGGIDYSPLDSMKSGDIKTDNIKSTDRYAEEALESARGLIRKVAYLPGTKAECENIICILDSSGNRNTSFISGKDATEYIFKSLSPRKPTMLHVSTHGFFNNKSRKGDATVDSEEITLSRSGLLFAGVETTLAGKRDMSDAEDGIVTAYEISLMDLRSVDLAVLSACQTAMGEIKGDGVFGLQRGFKKAGANSILMSLWKVDDEATSYFMTTFYKNLASGKSKAASLEASKRSVRARTDRGWDAPRYWAPFILLDGI